MYNHTERWIEAQKIEVDFWIKDFFRDSEFCELEKKYKGIFSIIENKYSFSSDTKILDLGCGATCPSILFSKGKKFGVDPLVEIYLEKDKQELSGKIELVKGIGEDIPFENSFFDVVLCRNALDHMDNIQNVMEEIKRVTKRQGIIILSIYTYSPFINFLKRISELIPFLRNIEHPHSFTPKSFKKLCDSYFLFLEDLVIFEGKSSIDYGKEDVEMFEPFLNKIFAWINKYVFMNSWFLREYQVISKRE